MHDPQSRSLAGQGPGRGLARETNSLVSQPLRKKKKEGLAGKIMAGLRDYAILVLFTLQFESSRFTAPTFELHGYPVRSLHPCDPTLSQLVEKGGPSLTPKDISLYTL